jgi:hypothetical protein
MHSIAVSGAPWNTTIVAEWMARNGIAEAKAPPIVG